MVEQLLTTGQLARALRVKPATIRSWVRRGLIPVIRVGEKTLRFSWPAVKASLEDSGGEGAA